MNSTGYLPGLSELILCCFAFFLMLPLQSYDVWWHASAGRYFWLAGPVSADPFSWLAGGRPWVAHEWLFDLLVYPVLAYCGAGGLAALKLLLLMAPFLLWWRYYQQRCFYWVAGLAGLFYLLALCHTGLLLRPQLCTYAFLLYLILYLNRTRTGWLVVPLLYLWANLHAGFAVGLLVLGVAVVFPPNRQRLPRRRLALLTALAVLVSCLTPHGPQLLLYPLQYLGATYHHRYIQEWQRPVLANEIIFSAGVVGLLLALLMANYRRAFDWVIAGIFIYLSYSSRRYFPLYGVATVLPLTRSINLLWRRVRRAWRGHRRWRLFLTPQRRFPVFFAVVILLLLLVSLTRPAALVLRPGTYPVASTAWLQQHQSGGCLFNTYRFGGYLLYHLYPRWRTGLDGRMDIFTPDEVAEYVNVLNGGAGWREYLDRHEIAAVVIDPGTLLAAELASAPDWERVVAGPGETLFVRKAS